MPYADADVERSSCYVMPILVEDDGRRDARAPRAARASTASRRRVFYPAVHEFTAYRERFGEQHLPHTERAARTEITLPLFAHIDEPTQDRVVDAPRGGARGMSWDIPLTDVVITERTVGRSPPASRAAG